MKKLAFLLLFTTFLFAQESKDKTIYLDSLYREVPKEKMVYTKTIKDYYLEKTEYKQLLFYKNGNLKSEEKTFGKELDSPTNGEVIEYYESGNKKSSCWYENNLQNGKFIQWYESGKLKEEGEYILDNPIFPSYKIKNFWKETGEKTVVDGNGFYDCDSENGKEKGNYLNGLKNGDWTGNEFNIYYSETYKNGVLVSGESRDNADGSVVKYNEVKVLPFPKKGMEHFYNYIANNFELSRESIKNKISGKIFVNFVVLKDGRLGNIEISKGLGYGLDEEAIRVIKGYGKWIPANQRGRIVKCSFMIPIRL